MSNIYKRNTFTLHHNSAGFTLIELIMVVVIISIIALPTTGIIIFFMRNTIFLPSQMNVQQAADVAMDIIVEGDDRAKGLRFASEIVALRNNRVRFINADGQDVRFRRNRRNDRLERRIEKDAWEVIPYYATGDLRVTRQPGGLFNFFDEDENATTTPKDVRRIRINLLAQSGAGDINNWEGQVVLGSSVKLYKLNQPPVIIRLRYKGRKNRFRVMFTVDDPDGGQVSWTATVTGDPGGNTTLDVTSGSETVRYPERIWYTPVPGFIGTATITIDLDDGDGGTAIDSIDIPVSLK